MQCKHCGSEDIQMIKIRNGGEYPEIIHRPHCKLLHEKRGVTYEKEQTVQPN